jgi:hypothetical protein
MPPEPSAYRPWMDCQLAPVAPLPWSRKPARRLNRHRLEMIISPMARPVRISRPAKTRPGVPMTHSSARKMTSRMNVVPRSSPVITSRHSTAVPGMNGTSMCRQSASWPSLSLRASRSAPHTTRASLAISDGWICCPPMAIHRVAPFCETPTPWIRVRPSPTAATASSG